MNKQNKKYGSIFLLLLVFSFVALYFPWGRMLGIIGLIVGFIGIIIILTRLQNKFDE